MIVKRQKNFYDFYATTEFFYIVEESIKNKKLPKTILFYGPSGTGKTNTARLLAAKLLDIPEEKLENFLESGFDEFNRFYEINVSNNSGIEFARKLESDIKLTEGMFSEKLVINLNEVTRITKEAQKSLLDIIEKVQENVYKNVYIFATSSDISNLLPDFRRRFIEIKFSPLSYDISLKFIKQIIEENQIKFINDQQIDTIIKASKGSPGFILKNLETFVITKNLPIIEEDEDPNISEFIVNFVKSVEFFSASLKNGNLDSSLKLESFFKDLDRFYEMFSSWETIRQKICFNLLYRIQYLSQNGKLNYKKLYFLNNLLGKLSAPIQDYNMAKNEIVHRFLDVAFDLLNLNDDKRSL